MSTKIKICGITCEKDIRILNRYLPDYAGFVFAESRRKVTAQAAKILTDGLDPVVKKAGVFVNMNIDQLGETVEKARLDIVQLHGDESREYIERLRLCLDKRIQIWKAVRVAGKSSLMEMTCCKADLYLADTYVKGVQGGTGTCFDWNLLKESHDRSRIILAGGLNPCNVREAISIAKPYGVDVSSGVETDGKKDITLVGEFITRVREMEG